MSAQYSKKTITLVLLAVLALVLAWWFLKSFGVGRVSNFLQGGVLVEETLTIPTTNEITSADTRSVNQEGYKVALVPENSSERVIVPLAIYTLKGSYEQALPIALAWSSDAELVLIKSLGAVTLEGKSSQWQVVFGSRTSRSSFEIIIRGNEIISKKEVASSEYGHAIPERWYDAGDAIASLQTLPQFSDATLSGITFFYNADSTSWGYGIATSRGATAMPVR